MTFAVAFFLPLLVLLFSTPESLGLKVFNRNSISNVWIKGRVVPVSDIRDRLHMPLRATTTQETERKGVGTEGRPLRPPDTEAEVELEDLDLPRWIVESNKFTVEAVKSVLSLFFKDRPYARFAALETIARVPYFSYTSVLHLYETLGWFRRKEYIQIHFAESWNELHHLLIMEELGGNKDFQDRFIAQHIAFFYYWLVVGLYISSPAVAYDLNKHVEEHAFSTYDQFLTENEEQLKLQPAPQVAIDYYQKGDMYMFDMFQSGYYHETFAKQSRSEQSDTYVAEEGKPRRRPEINNLYDVFCCVRADEAEHAETMSILQKDVIVRSRGDDEI
jgi:ubiquinol oxidase